MFESSRVNRNLYDKAMIYINLKTNDKNRQTSIFLKFITYSFMLLGIDIEETDLPRSMRIVQWISQKIMAVAAFSVAMLSLICLCQCFLQADIRLSLSLFLEGMSAVVLWVELYRSRTKIQKLIYKTLHIENILKVRPSATTDFLFFIWLLITLIFCYLKYFYFDNQDIREKRVNYMTFGYINLTSKFFSITSNYIYFVDVSFIRTVLLCVTILCTIFSVHFHAILKKHATVSMRKLALKYYRLDDVVNDFNRYALILELLQEFEDVMSFSAFIIFFYFSKDIFYTIYLLMKTEILFSENPVCFWYYTFNNLLCFSLILLSPSSINEADLLVKRINSKILQQFLTTGMSGLHLKLKYMSMNNDTAFVFTAWRFFPFTRGLFLTAVGSILTYTLVIINI